MDTPSSIAERRLAILDALAAQARKSGRVAPELVAVSKVQPDDRIRAALQAGQRVFGENRVQEAQGRWAERFADARKGLTLHLIGPLQTNKARDAVRLFDVIQTLDRLKLARALVRAADDLGRMPELMVQVNIGREPQKSGVMPGELPAFLDALHAELSLRPTGLMCIPPAGEPAAPHFWAMETLARTHGLARLSMGMSADYATAVAFGATHVRVGSALFGARDYSA